jgi:hypothetical protein
MLRLTYWLGLTALPYPVAASIVVSDFVAWLRRWWWLGGLRAIPKVVTVTTSGARS